MRKATYTTPLQDEVQLDYTVDAGDHHALTGTKQTAFYSRKDYEQRQQQHGTAIYPKPKKATVWQAT